MNEVDFSQFQKLGFEFRPNELHISQDTTYENWSKLGCVFGRIRRRLQWWVGDWLVTGERLFPKRYEVAMKQTGIDYGTLRNWAYIARHIPKEERKIELSYTSHRKVAHLPPQTREDILNEAIENDWNSERIGKELKARGLTKTEPEKIEMFGYELEFDRQMKALEEGDDTVVRLEAMMNGITNQIRELANNGNAGDARLRTAGVALVRALMQTGLDPRQVHAAYAKELRLPETRKENAEQAGLFEG